MQGSNNPKGRTPNKGVVHETNDYIIREVPLNFQIECKLTTPGMRNGKPIKVKAIPNPWYSPLEYGLPAAIQLAEDYMRQAIGEP
jgi:hypothetical protein